MVDIPERYKREDGKLESPKSYITFLEYYLDADPSPTSRELAELSGYSYETCKKWISDNKYRKRKSEYLAKKKQEHKETIKEVNKPLLPLLAQLKKAQYQMHRNAVNDVLPRQSYLQNLETLNPERLELQKENSQLQKDYINLVAGLRQTDEFNDYLQEQEVSTEYISELVEKLEDTREQTELDSISKLKEDMEDDEY